MRNFLFPIRNMIFACAVVLGVSACTTDDISDSTPTPQNAKQAPIGFGSYLSRSAQTRGTAALETADVALNGGIGIFAMYTEDAKYNPSATDNTGVANFEANFMYNTNLASNLSKSALQTASSADVAKSWTYSPIRYWPNKENSYVSFLAYAPFSSNYNDGAYPLLNKQGGTDGDRRCLYYRVGKTPRDQQDLMYSNGSNITNMQLYYKDGQWQKTGDFVESSESGGSPSVKLNFKHATSRVAFVVTSSELKNPRNYSTIDENNIRHTFEEIIRKGFVVDVSSQTFSDIAIDVNKVMFLGDNTSAESEKPKGVFHGVGVLDLAASADTKDPWTVKLTNDQTDLALTYDNTGDTIITAKGGYDGNGLGTIPLKNGGESKNYIWAPYEVYDADTELGYYWNGYITIYPSWEKTKEPIERRFLTGPNAESNRNDYANFGYLKDNEEETARNFINEELKAQWKSYVWGKTISGVWWPKNDGTLEAAPEITSVGNRTNDYMFIIPQDFSEGSGKDLWVYLDYTVKYTGGVSGDVAKKGINYKVYKKINVNFEPGKAYVLVFDIGSENFNAINFSVETTDWPDEQQTVTKF